MDRKETQASWSLFEEPYWLDAVAPKAWDAVEVYEKETLVGRLPFLLKKKSRFTYLTGPELTPWLGPWVKPKDGKYHKEISYQHQILTKLIDQLPKTQSSSIACAPEFTNLMAFNWADFDLSLRYTYRLENLDDIDALWTGLRDNIRRECRKAEKKLTISTTPDLTTLFSVVEKTFSRQNMDRKGLLPTLERIDAVMAARDQRRMYFALDDKEQVHAAIYIVYDERSAFYLIGGGDPKLRNSGAHSFLMWQAIKDAANHSKIFDFEGSMLQPVERFFCAFNARQVPRYSAQKRSDLFLLMERAKARIKR